MEKEKHISRKLFLTFAKIGAFTFGGGWAMIAIIEREVVDRHHWLTKDEFMDQLAVAQSMPGILAVNFAVAVGDKIAGTKGTVAAAFGTILPSFCIILCIAIFLTPDIINNNPVVSRIFKGIRPAVVALILAPLVSNWKRSHIGWRKAWIPVGTALLIWSGWAYISNPILFIVLGGVCGWWFYGRKSAEKYGKEDSQ